jgi:hypothetical protein
VPNNEPAEKPLLSNLVSFREDDQHYEQLQAIGRALRVAPARNQVVARIAFRVGLKIFAHLTEEWLLLLPPPPDLDKEQLDLWEEFVAQVQQTQR